MPNDFKGFIASGSVFWDVFLGAFGGFISYLFNYKKENDANKIEFSVGSMLIYIFLGIFIGYLTGTMIEYDTYGRDVIIAMSGLSAYNILILAESRFAEWAIEKFTKKD